MNKVKKQLLSILLSAALLFTSADFSVFAANVSGKTSMEKVWKEAEAEGTYKEYFRRFENYDGQSVWAIYPFLMKNPDAYESEDISAPLEEGGRTLGTFAYEDHDGALSSVSYGNGTQKSFAYDKRDRLTGVSYDGTEVYRYVYNKSGDLAEARDLLRGKTTSYKYDFLNRLTLLRDTDGLELAVHYDTKDRIAGSVCVIDAGALQKVTTKTDYIYGNAAAGEMPDVPYKVKIDGAERVSYRFDPLLRQAGRTLKIAAGVNETTSYTYKKSSRGNGDDTMYVESVTRSGNGASQTLWYSYDPHGNITAVKEGADKATAVLKKRYSYDSLDELVRADDAEEGKTHVYVYDEGGNLTSENVYSYQTADTVTGTALESHSYAYTNQWKDLLTSYDGTAITYDSIGNPLNYRGKSLTWQRGRELASVTTADGTWQYGYDDNGYRTEKTAPDGSTTKYYRNGTMLLAQVTADDRLDFFYDEKGQSLGFKYSVPGTGTQPVTSLYYYRMNLQGDIEGILDASGNEVCSYTYDAWGKMLGVTGSVAATIGTKNPLRYRGYFYDEETGWYYLNSRHYDPETRRMLSADTEEVLIQDNVNLSDKNLFLYCDNNPITRKDDGGQLWTEMAILYGIGTVSGALMGAFFAACNGESVGLGALEGAFNGAISTTRAIFDKFQPVKYGIVVAGFTMAVDIYRQTKEPSYTGEVDYVGALKVGVMNAVSSSLNPLNKVKPKTSKYSALGSAMKWAHISVTSTCSDVAISYSLKNTKLANFKKRVNKSINKIVRFIFRRK